MLKAVTLITIITSSNLSVAQEENIKPIKHSVGLNYSYSDWDELSFDFNYRRFFNGFNLKGAIQLTSPYNYNYGDNDINSSKLEYYNHPQLLSNIDTNGKFYGLDENYYQRERYVKIKVGVEKVFPSKSSVNVFVGADSRGAEKMLDAEKPASRTTEDLACQRTNSGCTISSTSNIGMRVDRTA